MDDNKSIVSSVYWDTTSIRSDSTIYEDCFQTPTESFQLPSMRVSKKDECDNGTGSVILRCTPVNLSHGNMSSIINKDTLTFDSITNTVVRKHKSNLQKHASVQLDVRCKSQEKKNWRHSFVKQFSFNKNKMTKTFSISKSEYKLHMNPHNIFLNLKNSIKNLQSSEKLKYTSRNYNKEPNTITGTLGSDCDYFDFENCSIKKSSESINDDFLKDNEETEEKTIIYFPEIQCFSAPEIIKKKFQNEKYFFQCCSSFIYIFELESKTSSVKIEIPKYIGDCRNLFLMMNTKQIKLGLSTINENLGQHFDLKSETFKRISEIKDFNFEELPDLTGVYLITDIRRKQKYVAVKRTDLNNWFSITSLVPNIKEDTNIFEDQLWICYPAPFITNIHSEKDIFEFPFNSKFIINILLQLLKLLRNQKEEYDTNVAPKNIYFILSNLSLICVYDKYCVISDAQQINPYPIDIKVSESVDLHYKQTLIHLIDMVNYFLSDIHNVFHFISASYPLDYIFFILLKLEKDMHYVDNDF